MERPVESSTPKRAARKERLEHDARSSVGNTEATIPWTASLSEPQGAYLGKPSSATGAAREVGAAARSILTVSPPPALSSSHIRPA